MMVATVQRVGVDFDRVAASSTPAALGLLDWG